MILLLLFMLIFHFDNPQTTVGEVLGHRCPKGVFCLDLKLYSFCIRTSHGIEYKDVVYLCGNEIDCDELNPLNGCVNNTLYEDHLRTLQFVIRKRKFKYTTSKIHNTKRPKNRTKITFPTTPSGINGYNNHKIDNYNKPEEYYYYYYYYDKPKGEDNPEDYELDNPSDSGNDGKNVNETTNAPETESPLAPEDYDDNEPEVDDYREPEVDYYYYYYDKPGDNPDDYQPDYPADSENEETNTIRTTSAPETEAPSAPEYDDYKPEVDDYHEPGDEYYYYYDKPENDDYREPEDEYYYYHDKPENDDYREPKDEYYYYHDKPENDDYRKPEDEYYYYHDKPEVDDYREPGDEYYYYHDKPENNLEHYQFDYPADPENKKKNANKSTSAPGTKAPSAPENDNDKPENNDYREFGDEYYYYHDKPEDNLEHYPIDYPADPENKKKNANKSTSAPGTKAPSAPENDNDKPENDDYRESEDEYYYYHDKPEDNLEHYQFDYPADSENKKKNANKSTSTPATKAPSAPENDNDKPENDDYREPEDEYYYYHDKPEDNLEHYQFDYPADSENKKKNANKSTSTPATKAPTAPENDNDKPENVDYREPEDEYYYYHDKPEDNLEHYPIDYPADPENKKKNANKSTSAPGTKTPSTPDNDDNKPEADDYRGPEDEYYYYHDKPEDNLEHYPIDYPADPENKKKNANKSTSAPGTKTPSTPDNDDNKPEEDDYRGPEDEYYYYHDKPEDNLEHYPIDYPADPENKKKNANKSTSAPGTKTPSTPDNDDNKPEADDYRGPEDEYYYYHDKPEDNLEHYPIDYPADPENKKKNANKSTSAPGTKTPSTPDNDDNKPEEDDYRGPEDEYYYYHDKPEDNLEHYPIDYPADPENKKKNANKSTSTPATKAPSAPENDNDKPENDDYRESEDEYYYYHDKPEDNLEHYQFDYPADSENKKKNANKSTSTPATKAPTAPENDNDKPENDDYRESEDEYYYYHDKPEDNLEHYPIDYPADSENKKKNANKSTSTPATKAPSAPENDNDKPENDDYRESEDEYYYYHDKPEDNLEHYQFDYPADSENKKKNANKSTSTPATKAPSAPENDNDKPENDDYRESEDEYYYYHDKPEDNLEHYQFDYPADSENKKKNANKSTSTPATKAPTAPENDNDKPENVDYREPEDEYYYYHDKPEDNLEHYPIDYPADPENKKKNANKSTSAPGTKTPSTPDNDDNKPEADDYRGPEDEYYYYHDKPEDNLEHYPIDYPADPENKKKNANKSTTAPVTKAPFAPENDDNTPDIENYYDSGDGYNYYYDKPEDNLDDYQPDYPADSENEETNTIRTTIAPETEAPSAPEYDDYKPEVDDYHEPGDEYYYYHDKPENDDYRKPKDEYYYYHDKPENDDYREPEDEYYYYYHDKLEDNLEHNQFDYPADPENKQKNANKSTNAPGTKAPSAPENDNDKPENDDYREPEDEYYYYHDKPEDNLEHYPIDYPADPENKKKNANKSTSAPGTKAPSTPDNDDNKPETDDYRGPEDEYYYYDKPEDNPTDYQPDYSTKFENNANFTTNAPVNKHKISPAPEPNYYDGSSDYYEIPDYHHLDYGKVPDHPGDYEYDNVNANVPNFDEDDADHDKVPDDYPSDYDKVPELPSDYKDDKINANDTAITPGNNPQITPAPDYYTINPDRIFYTNSSDGCSVNVIFSNKSPKISKNGKIFIKFLQQTRLLYKVVYNLEITKRKNNLKIIIPVPYNAVLIVNQNVNVLRNRFIVNFSRKSKWRLILRSSIKIIQPGVFNNITGLVGFEATLNPELTSISNGIFNNKFFKTVTLSDNQISYIHSAAFDNMKNLRQIDLSSNHLQFYDKNWFKNCPKLTWINLSQNKIITLSSFVFQNLYENQHLSIFLDYNQIVDVGDNIFEIDCNSSKDYEIDKLSLAGNELKCVNNFDSVLVAGTINLQRNPLTKLCKNKIKKWNTDHVETTFIL